MNHWDDEELLALQKLLHNQQVTPAEFVSRYLLKKPLNLQRKKLFEKGPETSDTMQFINDHHWKGHNDRIRRSLLQWHRGVYPLVLWYRIPTPFELLQIQSRGQRVVTVFLEREDRNSIHHGKTAWDFVVHDLIHADHFFEKPDWRLGQVTFYRFLLKNWNHPEVVALHNRPDFEYLIADMNSHPRHLFWTLKAIFLQSLKQKHGIEKHAPLQESLEYYYQSLTHDWMIELDQPWVLEKGLS